MKSIDQKLFDFIHDEIKIVLGIVDLRGLNFMDYSSANFGLIQEVEAI